MRDKQIHFTLSDEEHEELREVIDRLGVSTSDFLRNLIGEKVRYLRARKKPQLDRAIGAMMKAELAGWDAKRAEQAIRKAAKR